MNNTFHVKTSIISCSWFLDKCASNFICFQPKSLLLKLLILSSLSLSLSLYLSLSNPIWLISLCTILLFFVHLLSLGAGWWILNPCGLLGGGFLFQIAWQNLNHHHHQSQNHAQNHLLFFTFSPFSSSFSSSSIYLTNHTLLPWPLWKAQKHHQNQPCLPQPCTLRIATNPVLHLPRLLLLEENSELRLMKFQVVQTLSQINR